MTKGVTPYERKGLERRTHEILYVQKGYMRQKKEEHGAETEKPCKRM